MSLKVVDNTSSHESAHKRNPGFPLDLDWVERVRMNRSALERRAGTIGARRTVGQVARQHLGSHPRSRELLGEGRELVGAPRYERDAVATRDEVAGDGGADAGRGAGDDGGAIGCGSGEGHVGTLGHPCPASPFPALRSRRSRPPARSPPRCSGSKAQPAGEEAFPQCST